jgi:glyoxylase-like metal-dependent hydrolase (beta-lactamase superfamily II)
MKLHLFSSGSIITWKHLLLHGTPPGIRMEVPVPFYLLEHRKGLFLFDSGQQIPQKKLPDDADFITVLEDSGRAVNQLRQCGILPEDISGIILSHHHGDHISGIRDFPQVPCYVRKEELEYKGVAERLEANSRPLIFPEKEFDLCGDGEIILIPTPGHTRGHQSLLLRLDDGRKVLLAADAAYMLESLDQTPPQDSAEQPYWRSIGLLNHYRQHGVRIITGHDPEDWNNLKKYGDMKKCMQ